MFKKLRNTLQSVYANLRAQLDSLDSGLASEHSSVMLAKILSDGVANLVFSSLDDENEQGL